MAMDWKVEDRIRGIIAKQLNISIKEVTDEKSLVDDLKADPLDVVEIMMALETEFLLCIPLDDSERLTTVGEIIGYLKPRIGDGGPR